jgi:hypothetical protein
VVEAIAPQTIADLLVPVNASRLIESGKNYRLSVIFALIIDVSLSYIDVMDNDEQHGAQAKRRRSLSLVGVLSTVLAIAAGLFWLSLAVVGLAFLIRMLDPGFSAIGIKVQATPTAYLDCLRNLAGVRSSEVTAELTMTAPSRWFGVAEVLRFVPPMILGLLIVNLLRRTLATVKEGTPFAPENVKRLKTMGALILAAEVVEVVLQRFSDYVVAAHFELTGLTLASGFDFDVNNILLGLLLVVVAEVFRLGATLHEDQSFTV